MRKEQPVKSNAELVRLEQTLGLSDLDQPSALADLAAEARKDPLGWIKTYAPKLLAHHIVKLTIMGESPDPRIGGTALKAAADITIRAIGLLGTRGGTNEIACLEEIPEWGDFPVELRRRVEVAIEEFEVSKKEISNNE